MFDANDYKFSCKFADEVVSYLYNEMAEAEKAGFESHLSACSACSDELAAFGLVRSQVVDWKEKEFDSLTLPPIEIPYQTTEILQDKRSWLVSVSEFFTLSPTWATATAAFAALAICLSLVFLAVSSFRNNGEVVAKKDVKADVLTNTQPTPPANSEIKSAEADSKNSGKNDDEKSSEPKKSTTVTPDNSTVETATVKPVNQAKPKVVVIKETVPANSSRVKPVGTQNKTVKQPSTGKNSTNNNNVPNFIDDEEEDDSLRLADLLNELDSK